MKNSQQSTSSRRKSSRASNDDEKSERRRLRNRVSQQAFRARQTLRVQELEEQLEYLRSPEAARAAQLQAQNNILRDELLECYAKLGSLEISLRQLKDKTARALGIEANQPVSYIGYPHGATLMFLDTRNQRKATKHIRLRLSRQALDSRHLQHLLTRTVNMKRKSH